jgi:membrane protease YdiL (CAAX protease family)
MEQPASNLRVVHGYLLLLIFAGTRFVPALNQSWPWGLLAPLIGYFLVVLCVPTLRHSLAWLRWGRMTMASLSFSLLVMVVAGLILFFLVPRQNPGHREFLPFEQSCGLLAGGCLFSVCNALREEFFFRGILLDSLDVLWGKWAAIGISSAIFGLAHLHGVPSGVSGVLLAGVYGLALGGLRFWTGGLLLPILVHITADGIIFYSLARSGQP